jgi:hypothetical protein
MHIVLSTVPPTVGDIIDLFIKQVPNAPFNDTVDIKKGNGIPK